MEAVDAVRYAIANATAAAYARANISTVDVSQLNWVEARWVHLFRDNDYPDVTLAVLLFAVHEIFYFGRFFPYWIMDQIPFFMKYKIQGVPAPVDDVRKVVIHALLSQAFVQFPMMIGFYGVSLFLGIDIFGVPFPSIAVLATQQVYFALWEDTFHYWAHRAAHYGPLYKHVHKLHHEFQTPFGITAEYAHTAEVLVLGLGFFVGPLTWAMATLDNEPYRLHVVSMIVWMAVRLVLTVDDHSGYDFPWSLHNWIPFWGGADFHDYHHMAFVGNYSSTFRHWDWICGTDKAYKEHAAKLRATKKSKRAAAIAAAVKEAAEKERAAYGDGKVKTN
ncbi:C-4 sterol methyl oxidase [Cladochytrium tenue]|nr:C-4 sterol methyl oxidase [Cladochytrium tenue]